MVAFIGGEDLSGTVFADADLRGVTCDRQAQVRAFLAAATTQLVGTGVAEADMPGAPAARKPQVAASLAAATTQLLHAACRNPNDPSGGRDRAQMRAGDTRRGVGAPAVRAPRPRCT